MVRDLVRRAAEEQVLETALSPPPYHDHVGIEITGDHEQSGGGAGIEQHGLEFDCGESSGTHQTFSTSVLMCSRNESGKRAIGDELCINEYSLVSICRRLDSRYRAGLKRCTRSSHARPYVPIRARGGSRERRARTTQGTTGQDAHTGTSDAPSLLTTLYFAAHDVKRRAGAAPSDDAAGEAADAESNGQRERPPDEDPDRSS